MGASPVAAASQGGDGADPPAPRITASESPQGAALVEGAERAPDDEVAKHSTDLARSPPPAALVALAGARQRLISALREVHLGWMLLFLAVVSMLAAVALCLLAADRASNDDRVLTMRTAFLESTQLEPNIMLSSKSLRSPNASIGPDVGALCGKLVVPDNCECVLVVPMGHDTAFDITDVAGTTVLKADLGSGRRSSSHLQGYAGHAPGSLALTSAQGSVLALVCPTGKSMALSPEFQLMRGSGEYFARLNRLESIGNSSLRGGRYQLETLVGQKFHFLGGFSDHAVNVTDDEGRLLATTERCTPGFDPDGDYYRVRVGPVVDVGLVLCSLLAVDRLTRADNAVGPLPGWPGAPATWDVARPY